MRRAIASVAQSIESRSSKSGDAGGSPAGSAGFEVRGKRDEVRAAALSVLTSPLTPRTSFGRQADTSWLHLSRKQDRREPRLEHYQRLPPISIYDFGFTIEERADISTPAQNIRPLVNRHS